VAAIVGVLTNKIITIDFQTSPKFMRLFDLGSV
jgi:hypothetical protein